MRLRLWIAAAAALSCVQPAIAQQDPAAMPRPPVKAGIPAPAPDPAQDQQNLLQLELSSGGTVVIQLRPDIAPGHVERIKTLVNKGFYNGQVFHRVIDGFMAQTGDPGGTGEGGSDMPDLKSEFSLYPHLRGTVSMARTANSYDSANSQFFIMFMPRKSLDRKYTAFGRVISGMEYVDAIERGEPPANPTKILRATMAAPGPVNAVPAPAAQPATEPLPADAAEPPSTSDAVDAAAPQPETATPPQ